MVKETENWTEYDMSNPEEKAMADKAIKKMIEEAKPKKKSTSKKTKTTKKPATKKTVKKTTKKTTNKSGKSTVGRPTVMTKTVVSKLEEGFAKGLTDVEACLYANISKQSLYDYCKLHPEFTDRKEELKHQPRMKAKLIISDKLEAKDDYNARWYLERKAKDEFSTRQEVEQETHQINYSSTEWDQKSPEELKKAQEELLK